jgi:hypothetical protein
MAEFGDFDPSEFGGSVIQDATGVSSTKSPDFNPEEFGGTVIEQPKLTDSFDPTEFGGTVVDSPYKNVSEGPKVYTNSLRQDLLSRWQTTYSKMPDGPERERYGKLLSRAWDAHVEMQRYNDPLLFRAAESGIVTGGVGVMKGGLAGGEIVLSLPGVDSIPGAEGAKKSLSEMRKSLQAKQNLFKAKEEQFDKESAIGETAAGLTRDMSGFATQLLMAFSIPGAGAAATTLPATRTAVSVGEVALATMLGSEAAAHSLSNHPDDLKTAMLHGVLNGGAALFMGKSGDLVAKFGQKITPRAIRAVSNKLALTPIMDTLAHAQGAGAELAATAAADYMMDVALTKDEFNADELVSRLEGGYKAGAMLGGAMRLGPAVGQFAKNRKALKELGETLKKRADEVPIAAQAIADAREMYRKNEADIEAGISAKFGEGSEKLPEEYKQYFDDELTALQNLEAEYKAQVKSVNLEREQIKTRREETQRMLAELDELDAEVRGDIIAPTGHRIVGQRGRGDMMVEGTEGAIKDLQGMRDGLIAELKGLDQREFQVNLKWHSLDREGKSVKDFVESEFDRLASDEAVITQQSLDARFTKALDEAVALEEQIATGGRTRPEQPIPGQESENVPDTATDVELIDRLGHFTISGRQRDLNKMREFFDMEKLTKEESKGFEETLIRAQQRGFIDNAETIALEAVTSGQLLSDEQFMGVVERGRQNHGKYIDLMKERSAATTKEQKADIDTAMKALEDQQNILTQAAYMDNSGIGRRLNLAKMRLQEAYDPIALLSKADRALASRADRKTGGRDLTDVERENLLSIASRIQENARIKRENPDMDSKAFKDADYNEYLAKIDADRFIEKLRPRSMIRRVTENATLGLQDILKAMQLSIDASILTLHGGVPIKVAPSVAPGAIKGYFKAIRDPSELMAANRQIFERRANSDLYQKYDIGLRDVTSALGKDEGILLSQYSGQLPIIGRLNAGNTVALNNLRADLFDALVAARGGRSTATHEGLQSIASFVRTASGHGGLGPFESSLKALSSTFLAPRWFVSRFQHVLVAPYNMYRALAARDYATSMTLGRAYAQQYAMTSAVGYIAANVAALAYPGKVSYTMNPLNPNIGILNVNGTDYDITSGMRKPVRLVAAIGKAIIGADTPLDTVQTVGGLTTNALGPGGRIINEIIMRKETGSGTKIDFSNPNHVAWFLSKQIIPLPVQSFVRGLVSEGMSPRVAQETAASIMGVSAWKHKNKK